MTDRVARLAAHKQKLHEVYLSTSWPEDTPDEVPPEPVVSANCPSCVVTLRTPKRFRKELDRGQ